MARVKLAGIGKVYENGYTAVKDVSFDVDDAELIVLVGPSGCGKSTTLRMIAGLESISEGTLWIGDRMVNDVPPKDRDIAMVFQNYALYPHMSVYDNLAFGLKLRQTPKAEIERQVRSAAEILGLESILDRKPRQLSGGQRQRVAVGRAIVRKPQVFLFDEPLSNLDAKLRVQTRKEISRLHQRLGATMIYVTHDQVEAMTLGDRIVVMNQGRVQQIDAPLELYHRPANRFVAGFIGSPAMNFVDGRITSGGDAGFEAWAGELRVPLAAAPARSALVQYVGKDIVLGVRPEDVRVGAAGSDAEASAGTLTLDLVEPMGNELFVYASRNGHELVARVSPRPLPAQGERIVFSFDATKLHFFDPRTEECIA